MYEIKKKRMLVNGVEFDAFERNAKGTDSTLTIIAGTTGFKGGERDAGGRTVLKIKDKEHSDLYTQVTKDKDGNPDGFVLAMCGDDALYNLIRGLQFAVKALTDQTLEGDE